MKKVGIVLAIMMVLFTQWTLADDTLRVVQAVKTETPSVDGLWEDSEWNYGGAATDFTQKELLYNDLFQ